MIKLICYAVFAASALLAGLGSNDGTIHMQFAAAVGSEPFHCGRTYHGFRLYLAICLIRVDGARVSLSFDAPGSVCPNASARRHVAAPSRVTISRISEVS